MLSYFRPTWVLDRLFTMTADQLHFHGFKGILVDLDNTLVEWHNPHSTTQASEWVKQMQADGIQVMIVSNNTKKRVGAVADEMGVDFVSDSLKPTFVGMRKARKRMGLFKDEVVMIGDQVLTDVLGANLYGIASILVKPLVRTDARVTVLNRYLEKKITAEIKKDDDQGDLRWEDSFDEPRNQGR